MKEEILKDINNYISFSNKSENFSDINEYLHCKELARRLQSLLDLYKKSKEDVIKQYELGLTQGAYEKNLVWEDKIREKMKEVEHLSTAGYEILKELLGKEE